MTSLPFLTAHLDLKGVVYRPERYPAYLKRLKQLGFSAVLVEYEDRSIERFRPRMNEAISAQEAEIEFHSGKRDAYSVISPTLHQKENA